MHVMSTPTRQKSWQTRRERVSVLAALAIQKETVSRVLAELRDQHGNPATGKPLPQEKAAARAGITVRQWQRWESGESEPYLRNLEAVAAAFGLPVSRFFTMEEQDAATTPLVSLQDVASMFAARVDEIEARQKHLVEMVEARVEHDNRVQELLDKQNALLAGQTKLLDQLDRLVKRLVAAGVPAPPVVRDRRATGETPTPPTGQPERRQAAGGSRRDTA